MAEVEEIDTSDALRTNVTYCHPTGNIVILDSVFLAEQKMITPVKSLIRPTDVLLRGRRFKWLTESQWKQFIAKKKKEKKKTYIFRHVLNSIYLTFLVPLQFKFVIFYE